MKNFLKNVRKNKGLTLKQLSEKTNISLSAIGNYETGKRGMNEEYLKNIAGVLRVSVEEISPVEHKLLSASEVEKTSLEIERLPGNTPLRPGIIGLPSKYAPAQMLESALAAAYEAKDWGWVAYLAAQLERQTNPSKVLPPNPASSESGKENLKP